MLNDAILDPEQTTRKADLIAPLLLVLAKAELMGHRALTTQSLRRALREIVVASPKDLEKTPGDDVTRVERAVRNLVSHNDLVSQGLVKMGRQNEGFQRHTLELTDKGRDWLLNKWLTNFSLPDEPVSTNPEVPSQAQESKLTRLALIVIAWTEQETGKPVTTQQLRDGVRRLLVQVNPADVTAKNPSAPWETPLDRAVRNLISHDTLGKNSWVRRSATGLSLTPAGRRETLNQFLSLLPNPNLDVPAPVEPATVATPSTARIRP